MSTKHELLISQHAEDAFHDIIRHTQEVSLVAAERLRNKILHKLHGLQHHPEQGSRKVDGMQEEGFRSVTVSHCRIFFTVSNQQVLVHDMLVDRGK
ncbi:MAG: type II toxin-antitoxin system RelE/ParE family toxin [Flavobacteriales bacterium]|nr:type II toxin-antitoxin system RelE/ParE family toxin [Flavobacteriales bacterium]